MDQRFNVGLSMFLLGIAWNVYFSVREIADDSVIPYGPYVMVGGAVALVGLLVVVVTLRWPSPPRGD